MAQQIINIGTVANDGTGDPLRTAMDKTNNNFTELYTTSHNVQILESNVIANANVTYSLGNATNQWDYVYANTYSVGNAVIFNGVANSSISWNTTEDVLDIAHEDGTILQTGLENYIKVQNNLGFQANNGTVVAFAGVASGNPSIQLHIGDGSINPVYTLGVMTANVANGSAGRVTNLGKVRDIDTTGTDVGESWSAGQVLYVNPAAQYAGKLTNVRPTAPNVAISVAAVLSAANPGELLVRPNYYEQEYYGVFSRTTANTAPATNTAVPIVLDTTNIAEGISLGTPASRIVFANQGLYNVHISAEFRSTNASSKDVYIWFRQNGTDVPNSTRIFTMTNNGAKQIVAVELILQLAAGDYVEPYWATTDLAGELYAQGATGFAPAAPSVRIKITQDAQ